MSGDLTSHRSVLSGSGGASTNELAELLKRFDQHVVDCAEDKQALRDEVKKNTETINVILQGKRENGRVKYIGLQDITHTYLKWKRRLVTIFCSMVAGLLTIWLITHFDLFSQREQNIERLVEALQEAEQNTQTSPNVPTE